MFLTYQGHEERRGCFEGQKPFSRVFCILNGELDGRKHAMKAVDGFLEGNMKVRSCMHMDHGLQKMMTYLIFFRHNIVFCASWMCERK